MRQGFDVGNASSDVVVESMSVDTLVQRCLPSVQQWAHGKLPRGSRGDFDTKDLVQEAALRMLKRRFLFEPRHAHAVQAYMRRTIMNLVRDEASRRTPARRPECVDVGDEIPCDQTGPLEITISNDLRTRYEAALRDPPT